jgi:hypothetical protein
MLAFKIKDLGIPRWSEQIVCGVLNAFAWLEYRMSSFSEFSVHAAGLYRSLNSRVS